MNTFENISFNVENSKTLRLDFSLCNFSSIPQFHILVQESEETHNKSPQG